MCLILILIKGTLPYLEKVSFILLFYVFRFYYPFPVPNHLFRKVIYSHWANASQCKLILRLWAPARFRGNKISWCSKKSWNCEIFWQISIGNEKWARDAAIFRTRPSKKFHQINSLFYNSGSQQKRYWRNIWNFGVRPLCLSFL